MRPLLDCELSFGLADASYGCTFRTEDVSHGDVSHGDISYGHIFFFFFLKQRRGRFIIHILVKDLAMARAKHQQQLEGRWRHSRRSEEGEVAVLTGQVRRVLSLGGGSRAQPGACLTASKVLEWVLQQRQGGGPGQKRRSRG